MKPVRLASNARCPREKAGFKRFAWDAERLTILNLWAIASIDDIYRRAVGDALHEEKWKLEHVQTMVQQHEDAIAMLEGFPRSIACEDGGDARFNAVEAERYFRARRDNMKVAAGEPVSDNAMKCIIEQSLVIDVNTRWKAIKRKMKTAVAFSFDIKPTDTNKQIDAMVSRLRLAQVSPTIAHDLKKQRDAASDSK